MGETQELMPLLRAIRKAKLKIAIFENRADVADAAGRTVDASDLVEAYSTGDLPLDDLVASVRERLSAHEKPPATGPGGVIDP